MLKTSKTRPVPTIPNPTDRVRVVRKIDGMAGIARELKRSGKRIGLVPTMGFLHEGHLSLMKCARPKCDILIVSIYVNPTQFSPGEDLSGYPRDFERDEALCERVGVDIIFYPPDTEMYPDGFQTEVSVKELSRNLCGKSRPTHFDGVTTVVAKLFNIVLPDIAVFGRKDAQQAAIIRRMVLDMNFPVEIIVSPIVREPDGLAMSSRNKYLSTEERRAAPVLHESLRMAKSAIESGKYAFPGPVIEMMKDRIIGSGPFEIDYIEIVNPDDLSTVEKFESGGEVLIALAVKIGGTRLIDNIEIGT